MNTQTVNTPEVVIETTPEKKKKEASSLGVSCDTVTLDAKAYPLNEKSETIEPSIRLPRDWSSKRKWLIVTAISCVSFVVYVVPDPVLC
jgi:hypothetical protein